MATLAKGPATHLFLAVFMLVGTLYAGLAHAVCIASGDTQGIVDALAQAAASTSNMTVKLEQGIYASLLEITRSDLVSDVTIQGGYSPTPEHTCGEIQPAVDVNSTQILLNTGRALTVENSSGKIKLDNLTIGALTGEIDSGGGGVYLLAPTVELANVRVAYQRNLFGLTEGMTVGGVDDNVTIKMTNVQFDNLPTSSALVRCSVVIQMSGDASVDLNHVTADLSRGDICVDATPKDGEKNITIWNSIFWDWIHSGSPGTGVIAIHHDIEDNSSTDPVRVSLNGVDYTDVVKGLPIDVVSFDSRYPVVRTDPLWSNPAANDFSISAGPTSPAVNSGTAQVPHGEPKTDIAGFDRGIGSAPDMGAYESPYDDYAGGNTFIVTNTSDDATAGSLRWAISKANSSGSPSLIKFALQSCPSTIKLNAPLPDIFVPLRIDGYTSPGSFPNTEIGSLFNATVCVNLRPTDPSVTPNAFTVPSGAQAASLSVSGLRIGGFSQGIRLLGGFNHQIVGNEFGNLASGFQIYGFTVSAVSVDTNSPVIIGGSNPADRNLFLNANSGNGSNAAGVLIGAFANGTSGCQIVGNLFGTSPDGTFADPNNENGILVEGSGCSIVGNYLAGNIKDAISLIGGSHNVIQNNIIGARLTPGQGFYNPGAGIHITNGANDNVIGAGDGFYGPAYGYQNIVSDMDSGGVVVSNSTGNTIRGNSIYGNGLATEPNLDLGGDGPTPNDPGDADGGPSTANDGMNFPVAHGIRWNDRWPTPVRHCRANGQWIPRRAAGQLRNRCLLRQRVQPDGPRRRDVGRRADV